MSKYDESYMTGLYKQKYFCQMCNRQCQDRDGFNCHLKSETHKRHMEMVSMNPQKFINEYSSEFESGFLDILKRLHPNEFVSSNFIYQQYITDKFSTHLNATKWTSLTGFLKHLQTDGKCELKLTDKEIKIKYIDLTPESIIEKRDKEKKIKSQLREEKRKNEEMKKIMEKAEKEKSEAKISQKDDKDKAPVIDPESLKNISISFENNLGKKNLHKTQNFTISTNLTQIKSDRNQKISDNIDKGNQAYLLGHKRKEDLNLDKEVYPSKSTSNNVKESIFENSEDDFDLINDPWISKGMIVRIKDKQLNEGKYLNKKAVILGLTQDNEFIAEAELISDDKSVNKIIIKIDQAYLEPVIPSENNEVAILFGKHKGRSGRLKEIRLSYKQCLVQLSGGDGTISIKLNNICNYNLKN